VTEPAILATGISKRYRLGERQPFKSLRAVITSAFRHPQRSRRSREYLWALDDMSFEISRGEAVGIIGRNGAGKSTLLKVLSRITQPTKGRAEIRGRIGSLLEVGTGFHPELTGRENILLNGAILGMGRREILDKLDQIVAFAEVERFVDTPVKRYSSGMYLRLAFAVAAHLETEILLVDEVLAVGDLAFQKRCLGRMKSVSRDGRTVLFVSHNLAAIRSLCSRALLVHDGRLVGNGPVDEVIDQYVREFSGKLEARVDLPPASGADSPAEGTTLAFLTGDGRPQAEFRLHEPWTIRMDFDIAQPLDGVVASMGLMTVEGVPVTTYYSRSRSLNPGSYTVDFEVDLPLSPCDLQFNVGILSARRLVYYHEGIGHVSVIAAAVGEQPYSLPFGVLTASQRAVIRPADAGGGD
jgi:lipopolysaccharide transport system ATP-binding protein